jgi:excisionase family DNA binding protein
MSLQDPLLTTEDVANYLKVEVVTVRRLVGRGELAAYRVGGEFRFAPSDVQDYLRRQYLPARPTSPFGLLPGEPGKLWLSALFAPPIARGRREAASGQRFTKDAQSVLALSQSRAEQLGSAGIETVHLLLGLAAEPDGLGGKALAEFGATEAHLSGALSHRAEWLGPPRTEATIPLSLAPGTMRALRSAVEQAHKLKHDQVGTEHLLLGILADSDSSAAAVLSELKVNADKLRARVQAMIKQGSAPQ